MCHPYDSLSHSGLPTPTWQHACTCMFSKSVVYNIYMCGVRQIGDEDDARGKCVCLPLSLVILSITNTHTHILAHKRTYVWGVCFRAWLSQCEMRTTPTRLSLPIYKRRGPCWYQFSWATTVNRCTYRINIHRDKNKLIIYLDTFTVGDKNKRQRSRLNLEKFEMFVQCVETYWWEVSNSKAFVFKIWIMSVCYNSSGYDDRSFDAFDDSSSSDSGFEKSFERSFELQHASRRLNFDQSVVSKSVQPMGLGCDPLQTNIISNFSPDLGISTSTPTKVEPKPKRKYAVGKNRMTRTRSPEQVNTMT